MAKASATPPKAAKAAAPKAAAKAPKKAAAKKVAAKSAAPAAKGNAGLAKPLTPSADLAKVVGKEPIPRTEIIKKMWEYIKAKGLQDKTNKRMINADDKLKVVFDGKTQVSMFELAKVINNHVK